MPKTKPLDISLHRGSELGCVLHVAPYIPPSRRITTRTSHEKSLKRYRVNSTQRILFSAQLFVLSSPIGVHSPVRRLPNASTRGKCVCGNHARRACQADKAVSHVAIPLEWLFRVRRSLEGMCRAPEGLEEPHRCRNQEGVRLPPLLKAHEIHAATNLTIFACQISSHIARLGAFTSSNIPRGFACGAR